MSRGYYVPCAPFLYLVPDSGGMECMPLQPSQQQQPFQCLIHEQAKSLVALQELQNEVGALLEFRDLVMETFPHLRHKLASHSTTASLVPTPRGRAAEWEPGVRVRRRLLPKELDATSLQTRVRKSHQQQQPKSGDGSGTSSAGSSAVQDSGFGTETSSKASAASTATVTPGAAASSEEEAEDELWNLLDVIHRKGTRLRAEVAQMQLRLRDPGEDGDTDTDDHLRRERDSLRDELAAARRALKWRCRPLGALDGVVSDPTHLPRVNIDPRKVAAILREFNPVELQRHLLTTTAHNQALQKRLTTSSKLQSSLVEQMDKVKDENDDLRFQLEEKNIELEGTRARVRVLERLQQKNSPLLPPEETCNPILPLLALPMPISDETVLQHHSSSTESAHDHSEVKQQQQQTSPKRKPSKIPLPGTKSYCAPKPPSGKANSIVKTKDLSVNRGVRESSWKSNNSLSSNKTRDSVSGGRNSSMSVRNNSRDSLNATKSKDSLSSKSDSIGGRRGAGDSLSSGRTSRDTPGQNSFSSNISLAAKSKEMPGGWKGSQHVPRRIGDTSMSRSNVIDQGDENSKVLTSSDSLEPKLSCSTTGDLPDDVLGPQELNSFSDSLDNHMQKDVKDLAINYRVSELCPSPKQQSANQMNTCSTDELPQNSSSMEYFDSINSESVCNNSVLNSCSYIQDHYLHSSSRHEGLADCDSLEKKSADDLIEAFNQNSALSVNVTSTRNLWLKSENLYEDW